MAKFKLYLLTPKGEYNKYFADLISSFDGQFTFFNNRKNSTNVETVLGEKFNYTFNEKISLGLNSQKTLQFDMPSKLMINNSWIHNPFIARLHIGSQILLEDKNSNFYVFTIKQIGTNLSDINTTYSYSCQDSFSYNMIRRNEGYSIINDASSVDFIGAQTIDWWMEKIVSECYISDAYIKTTDSIFLSNNNEVLIFNNKNTIKTNIKKIIKDSDDLVSSDTFSFNCDNSSAQNAIISLAELVNYSLAVFEHIVFGTSYDEATKVLHKNNTIQLFRYFWLEPTKISKATPYLYSPRKNIEKFSLDHSSDSLTTVLNIKTNTIGDEMVSLLPAVPARFSEWFQSQDWQNSIHTESFYKNKLNGVELTTEGDFASIISFSTFDDHTTNAINNGYIYIPIVSSLSNKIKIRWWDNKFKFSYDNKPCVFYITRAIENEDSVSWQSESYTSNSVRCHLKIIDGNNSYELIEGDEIPSEIKEKDISAYIVLKDIWSTDNYSVQFARKPEINLYFYSDISQEEQDFAELADKIPWLENKIIDFNYFLNNNIITNQERDNLMNIINNDLRIVNGQLLCYAKEYYNSLKSKVELIAELENSTESLHAELEANGISPYFKKGCVDDLSTFLSSYTTSDALYKNTYVVSGASDIQNNYFVKFFKAQQRFMKNIYEFNRYFNSPVSSMLSSAYQYDLTLRPLDPTSNYFTFAPHGLKMITSEEDINKNYSYYKRGSNGNYEPISVVHNENFTDFYVCDELKTLPKTVSSLEIKTYDPSMQYLLQASYLVPSFIMESAGIIKIENSSYYILTPELLRKFYFYSLNEKHKPETSYISLPIFIREESFTTASQASKLPSILYYGANVSNPITYQNPNDFNFNAYYLSNEEELLKAPSDNPYQFYLNCGGYSKFFTKGYKEGKQHFISPAACLEALSNTISNQTTKTYDNYYKHVVATSSSISVQNASGQTVTTDLSIKSWRYETINVNNELETVSFPYDVYWSDTIQNPPMYADLQLIPSNTIVQNTGYFFQKIDWNRTSFKATLSTGNWERFSNSIVYKSDYEEFNPFTDIISDEFDDEFLDVCDSLLYIPEDKFIYTKAITYSVSNKYFEKKNGVFQPVLHIGEIIPNYKYYTLNSSLSISEWGTILEGSQKDIWAPVYLHQRTENGEIIRKYPKLLKITLPVVAGPTVTNDDIELSLLHDGVSYQSKLSAKSTALTQDKQPKNNGSFWYTYIDSNQKLYQEKALMIEQQLNEYWQQAYLASKYCDYFIPETWTKKQQIEPNTFFNQLFTVDGDNLKTTMTFIPQVELVSENGATKLPAYEITYDPYWSKPEAGELASVVAGQNRAFIDLSVSLFNSLNNMSHFKLKPTGANTTYYYVKQGGMKWSDLLAALDTKQQKMIGFSGLYGLMFNWSKNFVENEFSTYTQLQEKKKDIWVNLHHMYSHLFFEGVFEYPTATSSEELYNMSMYYFKEKSKPEVNYSITVLDAYSLKGYNGEELRVGHPILVDATEYSFEDWDIKKSIDQYLFITDISYSLRSDTNISLTVNSIKYDDKLIQKLAKLIR